MMLQRVLIRHTLRLGTIAPVLVLEVALCVSPTKHVKEPTASVSAGGCKQRVNHEAAEVLLCLSDTSLEPGIKGSHLTPGKTWHL